LIGKLLNRLICEEESNLALSLRIPRNQLHYDISSPNFDSFWRRFGLTHDFRSLRQVNGERGEAQGNFCLSNFSRKSKNIKRVNPFTLDFCRLSLLASKIFTVPM
jgi:hypothetical protein